MNIRFIIKKVAGIKQQGIKRRGLPVALRTFIF
jgi:hypothetical protein